MFQTLSACTNTGVATLNCIPILFHNITNAFIMFAGAVALFLISYAAIRMIMSGGDAKQVAAARGIMTYAIVGLIVVLLAVGLVLFVGYITNSTKCIGTIENVFGGCK